jgi:hypothetical protein
MIADSPRSGGSGRAPVPAGLAPARIERLRQKLTTAPPSLRQRLRLI